MFPKPPAMTTLQHFGHGALTAALFWAFLGVTADTSPTPTVLIKRETDTTGATHSDIQCYALPYGGIGLLSHLLTLYTFICLNRYRSPLRPWTDFNPRWWDYIFAIVGFMGSITATVFTMFRCHGLWQLEMIAASKLILSAALGFSTLTLILPVIKDRFPVGAWVLLYIVGFIMGMVGVGSLAKNNWEGTAMRFITYGFSGLWISIALLIGFGLCVVWLRDIESDPEDYDCGPLNVVCFGVLSLCIAGTFYGDWVLAAITGDWAGTPSSDVALIYWVYFVVKRFPMFTGF